MRSPTRPNGKQLTLISVDARSLCLSYSNCMIKDVLLFHEGDIRVGPCKVIHEHGIQNPAYEIRNPTTFVMWNRESTNVESRIQLMKSGIQPLLRRGIRNPQTWNPESSL